MGCAQGSRRADETGIRSLRTDGFAVRAEGTKESKTSKALESICTESSRSNCGDGLLHSPNAHLPGLWFSDSLSTSWRLAPSLRSGCVSYLVVFLKVFWRRAPCSTRCLLDTHTLNADPVPARPVDSGFTCTRSQETCNHGWCVFTFWRGTRLNPRRSR
jgi:hypothetical protein